MMWLIVEGRVVVDGNLHTAFSSSFLVGDGGQENPPCRHTQSLIEDGGVNTFVGNVTVNCVCIQ